MKDFQPKWLRIETRARDYPMTQEILAECKNVPVEYIDDWKTQAGRGLSVNQRFTDEKGGLILAVKDGALVKTVDRDLFREIPNEFYIIHSMGCPYDCQYCFLFDYLDNQIPTIFVNIDDILAAIKSAVSQSGAAPSHKKSPLRVIPSAGRVIPAQGRVIPAQGRVIPAQAGIQDSHDVLDSRLRGNDTNLHGNDLHFRASELNKNVLGNSLREVSEPAETSPPDTATFHAGEFSDALAFDHLTNLSAPLVNLFGELQNARLELRTKSNNIHNLIGLRHNGNTTVSWTFSPRATIKNIEFHTASLDERIDAARTCQQAGYPIGLRFDPIVFYENWESGFEDMITRIFAKLDPAGVQDCSLGIYRATPGLNNIVRRRFPRSKLHLGEMEQAGDGKYRYIRPVRVRMLKKIIAMLRRHAPGLKIELCMESPEVENSVLPLNLA